VTACGCDPRNRYAEAKWELAAQKIETQVVFMTFHADEDLMRGAMDAGGKGIYLRAARPKK
jgi:DNA-binding NarL/FixJ family response regulator